MNNLFDKINKQKQKTNFAPIGGMLEMKIKSNKYNFYL